MTMKAKLCTSDGITLLLGSTCIIALMTQHVQDESMNFVHIVCKRVYVPTDIGKRDNYVHHDNN